MTGNPTCHAKLDQRTPEATDQPAASKATGTPTPAADGGPPPSSEPPVTLGVPVIGDGPGLWRIARDSGPLDLNSPYSYLLWCRDFAHTSVAARAAPADGRPGDDPGPLVGFVTGYIRPEAPDTVVVWQIAVDSSQRGRGLARRMLHHLADRLAPAGVGFLEATITPGNEPSTRLFSGFARDVGAPVCRQTLFGAELFPPGHEPEVLFRIGPITRHPASAPTHVPRRPATAAPGNASPVTGNASPPPERAGPGRAHRPSRPTTGHVRSAPMTARAD